MGADLLLHVLAIPVDRQPDFAAARAKIAGMTALEIARLLAGDQGDSIRDVFDVYPYDTEDDVNGNEVVPEVFEIEGEKVFFAENDQHPRRLAEAAIDIVESAYSGKLRDTMFFTVRDVSLLVTGGTSWGEDPSDSYEPFGDFQRLGLDVIAGFTTDIR